MPSTNTSTRRKATIDLESKRILPGAVNYPPHFPDVNSKGLRDPNSEICKEHEKLGVSLELDRRQVPGRIETKCRQTLEDDLPRAHVYKDSNWLESRNNCDFPHRNIPEKKQKDITGKEAFNVFEYCFDWPDKPETEAEIFKSAKTGRKCGKQPGKQFGGQPEGPKIRKRWIRWDYENGLVRIHDMFDICRDGKKTEPAKAVNANKATITITQNEMDGIMQEKTVKTTERINDSTKEITKDLGSVCPNPTGGNITSQGYWVPYEVARGWAQRICWKIRFALTIIFGNDFPATCIPEGDAALGFGNYRLDDEIVKTAIRNFIAPLLNVLPTTSTENRSEHRESRFRALDEECFHSETLLTQIEGNSSVPNRYQKMDQERVKEYGIFENEYGNEQGPAAYRESRRTVYDPVRNLTWKDKAVEQMKEIQGHQRRPRAHSRSHYIESHSHVLRPIPISEWGSQVAHTSSRHNSGVSAGSDSDSHRGQLSQESRYSSTVNGRVFRKRPCREGAKINGSNADLQLKRTRYPGSEVPSCDTSGTVGFSDEDNQCAINEGPIGKHRQRGKRIEEQELDVASALMQLKHSREPINIVGTRVFASS